MGRGASSPRGSREANPSAGATPPASPKLSPAEALDLVGAFVAHARASLEPAPPPPPLPLYMGVRAYAKHAGVSEFTVRKWIEAGLPLAKTPGRTRIIVAEADHWGKEGPRARPELKMLPGGAR